MPKKYEYHKRNDYPGERIAERKRVEEREQAADKKANARVAEKGRTEGLKADARVAQRRRIHDGVLGNQIERSTDRATKVNRSRNRTDAWGLIIGIGVIVILVAGLGWSVLALQSQSDEIDSLNRQVADSDGVYVIQTGDGSEQVQLYNEFLALTADDKEQAKDYIQFDSSYSDAYSYVDVNQICVDSVERSNNVNLAMSRFAEKEVNSYRQISDMAGKPLCKVKIDKLAATVVSSRAADKRYYDLNMELCSNLNMRGALKTDQMGQQWDVVLKNALNDAVAKTKAVTAAEKDMFACFAS